MSDEAEWQTGAPPLGQDIVVQTDVGSVKLGRLREFYVDGLPMQYMFVDGNLEMFEVVRWRRPS